MGPQSLECDTHLTVSLFLSNSISDKLDGVEGSGGRSRLRLSEQMILSPRGFYFSLFLRTAEHLVLILHEFLDILLSFVLKVASVFFQIA